MRYIIAGATALALIAGIALGFVVSRGLDGAASAAPAETKVREQNLDGSGLIRVHEQGIANVNVTNTSVPVSGTVDVGNLPAVQDVNVVSMPAQSQGRLITLSMSPFDGQHSRSGPMDISDCDLISIMSTAPWYVLDAQDLSLDGVHFTEVSLVAVGGTLAYQSAGILNVSVAAPFLKAHLWTNNGANNGITPEAWVWCES